MDQGITFNLLLYFWWNIIVVFSGFSNLFLDFLLNILDLRFTCDFWRILNNKGHFLVTWWFFFISVVCFDKVRLQISFWSHDVTQKIFKTQRKKKIKTFCLQHNVELLIFELELNIRNANLLLCEMDNTIQTVEFWISWSYDQSKSCKLLKLI